MRMLRLLAVGLLAAVAAATPTGIAAQRAPDPSAAPVSNVTIGAGGGTVFGAVFLPHAVRIPVGTTVTWTNAEDWGHQVTFFGRGAESPAGNPRQWPATVPPGSSVPYDGTGLIHSGVLTHGQSISVKFNEVGTFPYQCPIHPRMEGAVTVVAADQPYTTIAAAAAEAELEASLVRTLVDPNRAGALARLARTPLDDGSTLWSVPVGPRVQLPHGFLELAEYFPAELAIRSGDRVRWLFESPHTVTFLPRGEALPSPVPPSVKPADDYDGSSFYHSGTLSYSGEGLGSFELRFPSAGAFEYICLLHVPEGQRGVVRVE